MDHGPEEVVQLVLDCMDCDGPLNDPTALEQALRAAASDVGATVLQVARCDYVPHGVTMVAFLAESHLLVSTWPEHGFAIVEIMLCNPSMDPSDARRAIEAALRPKTARVHEVRHPMHPNLYDREPTQEVSIDI